MSKAHRPAPSLSQRRTALSVAPFEGFDRSASLGVPQELVDDQLASFTEGELKVLLAVMRATNGGSREGIALSVRVFCQGGVAETLPGRGTGLSPRTVQAASTTLELAGRLRIGRRTAPDGSGLPSLFSLPLLTPGLSGAEQGGTRFAGYAAGRKVRLPLLVIDKLMADLSGAELKVLLYVLRHTFCLGLPDEVMPMSRLVENTGLSLRHTRLAVAGLANRGVIQVRHRQDPERGKLPSSFGVQVIGEAAPFSQPAASGQPPRASRSDEQGAEGPRSVWLVPEPAPPPAEPARPNVILQMVPPASPAPEPSTPPLAELPPTVPTGPDQTGAQAIGGVEQAREAAPPARSGGMPRREIPAEMLQDNHPAWAGVKRLLAERLAYHLFADWVAPTHSTNAGGQGLLLIAVPSEYIRLQLESKLGAKVRQALSDAGYPDLQIRYFNYSGYIPTEPRAE